MITYVDTSVLLKLLIEEAGSDRVGLLWDTADALAAASLVAVEGRAALAAAARGGRISAAQHRTAKRELGRVLDELTIVQVTEDLVAAAAELAEQEALRGYDAVHLAAALTVQATVLASADAALCAAAERRGLHIANPTDEQG
ncbi:MAG: PIN domain-containing protein [Acidimicrobiia bacterium]